MNTNSKVSIALVSVTCGALCYFLSISYSLIAHLFVLGDSFPQSMEAMSATRRGGIDAILLVSSLIASPLIEGLAFPLLYFVVGAISFKNANLFGALFIILIFLAAFILHGLSILSIGRGLSFAVLACLYLGYRRSAAPSAYWSIVMAHFVWNALGLITIAVWTQGMQSGAR